MSLDTLKARIPDHAKDLRLNLAQIEQAASLSPVQAWGAALAAAEAAGGAATLGELLSAAGAHLDETQVRAARAAAAVMAMNNTYYRFVHEVANDAYGQLPARLRMQVIGNPGVDKLDFELWSLGVSAINGCSACMNAHETGAQKRGATPAMIQDVVRIASIVSAVARTVAINESLSIAAPAA